MHAFGHLAETAWPKLLPVPGKHSLHRLSIRRQSRKGLSQLDVGCLVQLKKNEM